MQEGNPLERNEKDAAKLAAKVEAKKKKEQEEAAKAAAASGSGGPPPPKKAGKAKSKEDAALDDLLSAGLSVTKKKSVKA